MAIIIGGLISAVIAAVGIYFKFFFRKSGAQGVAKTEEALLKDAVDRPKSVDDAIDRL